jgi:hypothetical protein
LSSKKKPEKRNAAWLREPLLQFLVLGAALFLLFQWRGDREPDTGRDRIVVSQGTLESLAQKFRRLWLRPPTVEELNGLVEDHIREEVYYREALAMGLDRDDTIVRRRMRQKMEVFFEDLAALDEPSDEELAAFLSANPERFRIPARLTFQHVYLNPDKSGAEGDAAAGRLIAALNRPDDPPSPESLGDPFMLGHRFSDVTTVEVDRLFGEGFSASLSNLGPGTWRGPVPSGYGPHLVRVENRVPGRVPELDEVREAVLREWTDARRKEINEATYQRLRERYTVVVEPLPDPKLASNPGES